ncbi:MAG: transposase [Desulfobacterium sp.]|nr:transposase [Desulfobacterium sp.]MBU3949657.1 transposase [Pseudomonadota bacterium]
MPRKSRIDAEGAINHVIARGINKEDIFSDDADYKSFLNRLGVVLMDTKTACYAWALLPNHFHLLLRTGNTPVSMIMRRLLTGYAVNYNHRHKRSGHLFQNRYKSVLCQEEPYLKELVRYIHLNPLRGGIISDYRSLGRYSYCGHGVILGFLKNDWQDTDYIINLFDSSKRPSRRGYSDFVRKAVNQGSRPELTGGGLLRSQGGWTGVKALRKSGEYQKGDERILGDSDFVTSVLSDANESMDRKYQLKAKGYNLKDLIERVAEVTGITSEDIIRSGRRRKTSAARDLLCYWATEYLGVKQRELSELLNVTQSAISMSTVRGRLHAEELKLNFGT